MAITMGTEVFRRIMLERERVIREAAVDAIADTMEETARFGWGSKEYVRDCVIRRLKARGWAPLEGQQDEGSQVAGVA